MASAVESVCGWELNNLDPGLFESRISGELEQTRRDEATWRCPGDCGSCEFLNDCSGPVQFRCLTPRNCEMMMLGEEESAEGGTVKYFALVSGEELRFLRLFQPEHYWATICYIGRDEVPDWALRSVYF